MRKLVTLAATTLAAAGLMAAIAAPANADRAFEITDPNGVACEPYCEDTGYQGTFEIGSAATGLCDVSFDLRIESDGALETYNTEADCHGQQFPFSIAWECDDTWPGQLRYPNTGAPKIDFTACLTYYPHNTNYDHQITVNVLNNPRRWEQLGTSITSAPLPIDSGYFQDYFSTDNVKAVLL